MTIQTALAKLRRRHINFTTLRAALAHNKLPTSTNWTRLETKFGELQAPALTLSSYATTLERIYRSNVDWGNKAVQLALFDNEKTPLLDEAVNHRYHPEYTPPVTPFPGYVTDAELAGLTLHPVLVATKVNDTRTGITLYFYARGYETEKEEFPVDQMTDEVSIRRFSGFDQVVAYRQLIFHRIDSVYIDARNRRVEFRLDITRLNTLNRALAGLKDLKESFRKVMQNQVNGEWEHVHLVLANFFPKIEQLYNDGYGAIVELGHNTTAGAINHGKMRGHSGDLRQDPSHIASMEASPTQKFAIQKAYSYYNGISNVHLHIPGKSSDASADGAIVSTVNTAIIEDCIDGDQFEDMMRLLR